MKEEEAFSGVGEISLDLRTDNVRLLLALRITKLRRESVAGSLAQSKRGRAQHITGSESADLQTRSTVSTRLFFSFCKLMCTVMSV